MEAWNWEPTMHLRYVRDWISDERTKYVLQQRWNCVDEDGDPHEDWREIPMAEER